MNAYFAWGLYGLQIVCLGTLLAYSIIQFTLVFPYLRRRRKAAPSYPQPSVWPKITVQLPIYNEPTMVRGLLAAMRALDYPWDLLEVQVLDDSTDETTALLEKEVAQYAAEGFPIHFLHRSNRQGFKAGALAAGMETATGEFIAIFDADFQPQADFLRRAVLPLLSDAGLGLVQGRWLFRNEDASLLTRLQALMLDAHFSIEQMGRNEAGYFFNFNGTAGLWRRSCIEQAGGWAGDTLTEDLDLSYRAQLKGWRFYYEETLAVSSELPATTPALRSQQFRWAKGPAQCLRKHATSLWSGTQTWSQGLHAWLHLLNSSIFVLSLVLVLHHGFFLLWAKPWLSTQLAWAQWAKWLWEAVSLGPILVLVFFSIGHFHRCKVSFWEVFRFFWTFPFFMAAFLSLVWNNSRAVFQAYRGLESPFVRTPKQGDGPIRQELGTWQTWPWGEFSFVFALLSMLIWGFFLQEWILVVFYFLPLLGYALQVNFLRLKKAQS